MAIWDSEHGRWIGDPGTLTGDSGYHPNYGPAAAPAPPGYNPLGTAHATGSGTDDRGAPTAQYGGQYGLANSIASQYGQQGQDYAHREIGDAYSSPYRMAQGADRGQQQAALRMQMGAALGYAPSAAAIHQGQAVDNSLAAQMAAAHSGSGPLASMSQGLASATGARIGAQAVNQGANARAGELDAANRGYLGQASGVYGADIGALTLDQQRELQQAEMNQKMLLGSQGLGNQVMLDQLAADSSGYNTRYGAEKGQATATQLGNAQFGRDLAMGGLSAGASLATAQGRKSSAPPDTPQKQYPGWDEA